MLEDSKDIYSEFTPAQIDAVKFPINKALKIVAGAGTGKTSVLSYRYLHLVLEKNINPENILALTFTKKAAFNLKKKVSEVIDNDYLMLKASIYNFDSFWLRLIFENPYLSGIDSDFKIMDNTDKRILRDEIINEMIMKTDKDFILNLKNINLIDIRRILLSGFEIIEKAKIKLINEIYFKMIIFKKIEQYKEEFNEDGNYKTELEYAELYSRLYNNYQRKIVEKKVLDFSDILLKAYYLLKDNPVIAEKYRKKFRYILIDEMQDTSYGQFEILKLLSEDNFKNVTVVGDDKQSIFGWRDAEIENIRAFPGEEKFLKENHRSYNEILDLANFTIFQDPYFSEKRKFLEIKNDKKGYKGEVAVKMFYSDNRKNEAEFVANEIIKLSKEGISLNNIAVLFRSKTYPRIFEEVFHKKEIPFCSIGGGYFDREEIKDVIAYLKILENPFDIPSLIRILENAPYPLNLDAMMKIGSVIKELKERYRVKEEFVNIFTVFENILNNKEISEYTKKKIANLDSLFRNFSLKKDELPLANLVYVLLEESKYFKMIYSGDYSFIKNRINILKNIYLMSQLFEKKYQNSSISDFVKYLELKIEDERGEDEISEETDKERVVFLTIHKAKGLEFDYVFFCDIRDNSFRDESKILLDIEKEDSKGEFSGYGLVLKYKDDILGSRSDKTEKYIRAKERLRLEGKRKNEEIRLKYVATTRAKEMLFLTATLSKGKLSSYYEKMLNEFGDKKYVDKVIKVKESEIGINRLVAEEKISDKVDLENRAEILLKTYSQKQEKIRISPRKKIMKLDFSMMKEYKNCPLKYKYIYEYKFPVYRVSLLEKETERINTKDSEDKYTSLIFGICVHRILENYYNIEDHPESLKRLMIKYGVSRKNYEEEYKERGEKIFINFKKFGLDKSQPIYTEKEFNLWLCDFRDYNIHIKGFIDRIDKKNGIWEIADYKTGLKGTTKNLLDDEMQMQIYDLAVSEDVFEDVENPMLKIYFLEEETAHQVKRNPNIKEFILSTAKGIIEKNFNIDKELHQDRDCWNCEFGGLTGFCEKNLLSLKDGAA